MVSDPGWSSPRSPPSQFMLFQTSQQGRLHQNLRFACRDPWARGGGNLEPGHCGQSLRAGSSSPLASRRGRDRHCWVRPQPCPAGASSLGGDFREESLEFQVVVPKCGLAYRPPATGPGGRRRWQRRGERRRGKAGGTGDPPGRPAWRPLPPALLREPSSASGLTFPLASQWAGPTAGSGLPCSLEKPCLRPRRRWHGDSNQVCKLVPLSPGQGEPWRLANMTQENVC